MLKVGDVIKCRGKEEAVELTTYLHCTHGIETDFLYKKDGEQGICLEVVKIEEEAK